MPTAEHVRDLTLDTLDTARGRAGELVISGSKAASRVADEVRERASDVELPAVDEIVDRLVLPLVEQAVPEGRATLDALLTLPGVGRKTANLVVTYAFGLPGICVDTHVHRITNRLGFVRTTTPERTEWALRAKLPRRHWIELNDLLVAFGQNVCQPLSPRCSTCPVARLCHRVGVTRSR